MTYPDPRLARRIQREALTACERSPEGHIALLRGLGSGAPPDQMERILDRALAGQRTVESSLAAARLARQQIEHRLAPVERSKLGEMEAQVHARSVGPSVLKSEIYRLARTHQAKDLLESSWFDELFDRVEGRRLTDQDREESA